MPISREKTACLTSDLPLLCRYITRTELHRLAALFAAACGESHHSDEQAHNSDFLGVHGSLRMSQVPIVAHNAIKDEFARETKW